uniref:Uncharacterized protein n=1 Tax=Oryza meridionalis TaxID=40149 RepID=A0A0E0E366_9ORYZ
MGTGWRRLLRHSTNMPRPRPRPRRVASPPPPVYAGVAGFGDEQRVKQLARVLSAPTQRCSRRDQGRSPSSWLPMSSSAPLAQCARAAMSSWSTLPWEKGGRRGGTWVIYKEVNWISSFFWVVLLYCFGSIATCAYVVVKLFEIKTSGPSQDPLDLLFLSILGAMMAAVVIYTVITDGLPFRKDLLTPWMAATLLDFYINVFAISVWVAHKESNWISTAIWICLLICFGSITTCGYIVIQLFQVSYQDPIYHWEPWSWSRSFMRHKLEQFVV